MYKLTKRSKPCVTKENVYFDPWLKLTRETKSMLYDIMTPPLEKRPLKRSQERNPFKTNTVLKREWWAFKNRKPFSRKMLNIVIIAHSFHMKISTSVEVSNTNKLWIFPKEFSQQRKSLTPGWTQLPTISHYRRRHDKHQRAFTPWECPLPAKERG